jgi:hypothetical protein
MKAAKPMCNYFGFMMILAGYATMLIICCMSIERVICIRHPYIYRTRSSTKHATHILLTCWSLAAFISLLPFMGFGDIVLQYPYTWCFFDYYSTGNERNSTISAKMFPKTPDPNIILETCPGSPEPLSSLVIIACNCKQLNYS